MITFTFNGMNSYDDMELLVLDVPDMVLPKRRIKKEVVPGRDGELHYDDGTYESFTLPVECYVEGESELGLTAKAEKISAWLAGASGKLIFSTQPDKYYDAKIINQIDFKNPILQLGKFIILFDCKPHKHFVFNDKITITESPGNILNPGNSNAKPVITIYGEGDLSLNINGDTVKVDNVQEYVTIDSDIMDCYKGTALKNNDMQGEFPELIPGLNTIEWLSGSGIDSARFFLNSKLIVSNPADAYYASYPNPPVGGVFNNINPATKGIVSGVIDSPAVCWSLVNLLKIYQINGEAATLNKAKSIGDYIISHIIDATFYGTALKLFPNQYAYADGNWTAAIATIHIRTQYHAMWALLELYKITETEGYLTAATNLLKSIALGYNNIKGRTSDDLAAYMVGSMYNTMAGSGSPTNPSITFSWNTFNHNTADMLSRALPLYIELAGNTSMTDWQGTAFTPQGIIDDFKTHVQYIYTNKGLTMAATGLPYGFMQYEYSDTPIAGKYQPNPKNFDWLTPAWGDVWFVNDLCMWIIIGLANLGLSSIATTYRNAFLNLRMAEHTDKLLFHDRYNYDGTHLDDDPSASIAATALIYECDNLLNIENAALHNLAVATLNYYMIEDADKNLDGGYNWDPLDANSYLEVKATGEIIYTLLKNGVNSISKIEIIPNYRSI